MSGFGSYVLKSVRIRPREIPVNQRNTAKTGVLDLKISVIKTGPRERTLSSYRLDEKGEGTTTQVPVEVANGPWPSIEYKGRRYEDLSDDDLIRDYIRTNTLRERPSEGEFVVIDGLQKPFYQIVQDPFEKKPPASRNFGFDPYYLNNGAQVFIRWYTGTIDPITNKLDKTTLNTVGGVEYGVRNVSLPAPDGIVDDARNPATPSISIKPKDLVKIIEVSPPDETSPIWTISSINEFIPVYKKNLNETTYEFFFRDDSSEGDFDRGLDWMILNDLLRAWNSKVLLISDSIQVCEPSYIPNKTIEYVDPVNPVVPQPEPIEQSPTSSVVENSSKIKLNILFPEGFEVKVREDSPNFKIFVGDIPTELVPGEGFQFRDDFEDGEGLDAEFTEVGFLGPEEELLQEQISIGQEDSLVEVQEPLDEPISVSVSSGSLDSLLRNAGRIARIVGKNVRVNYENLSIGYKKGIHGLCPQGTQVVLVALTGIKEFGLIRGNADWFSFKNPATGGVPYGPGKAFDRLIGGKTYYNPKIRINQINGSWKNTYLNDRKKWQVGDIIAMGYTGGKPYGHIQIWTGFAWMSDFKQNAIQQRNIDPDTVALWRLNENGLNLLRSNRFIS
jgi:hypothetical protein